MTNYYIAIDGWAGRRLHLVEIVGETAKKARVRILNENGCLLPGSRYLKYGDIASIPKYALIAGHSDADKT